MNSDAPRCVPACHRLYHNRFRAGPRHRIGAHTHLFWHAEYVVRGVVAATVAGATYVAKQGDWILLPPERSHAFEYRERGTEVFSVKFTVSGVALRSEALLLRSCAAGHGLWEALDGLLPGRNRRTPLAVSAAVDQLIAALVLLFADADHPGPQPDPSLAERVRAVIAGADGQPLTVGQIAQRLGFSPAYVRLAFRRESGEGLKRAIDAARAAAASRYLAYSDMSIKEIAAAMGFPDQQTFARFCRRMTGRTPGEARASVAQGTNVGRPEVLSQGTILKGASDRS